MKKKKKTQNVQKKFKFKTSPMCQHNQYFFYKCFMFTMFLCFYFFRSFMCMFIFVLVKILKNTSQSALISQTQVWKMVYSKMVYSKMVFEKWCTRWRRKKEWCMMQSFERNHALDKRVYIKKCKHQNDFTLR